LRKVIEDNQDWLEEIFELIIPWNENSITLDLELFSQHHCPPGTLVAMEKITEEMFELEYARV